MNKCLILVFSLAVLSACNGLGGAMVEAGYQQDVYKACIDLHLEEALSVSNQVEKIRDDVATLAIEQCRNEENAYILAITDVAMKLTRDLVDREKFLKEEEAQLRLDLHEVAFEMIEEKLR